MKIEHLYYFLVISETKSINKASQKLFISQQHLSRIINGLEDDLHVRLLNRTSTGIEVTEKGKIFAQFAEKIVNTYREMQSYFYLDALPAPSQTENIHGSCQIAFPFFFSLFLNDFIKQLQKIHPGISIRYYESTGIYDAKTLHDSNTLHVVVESKEHIQDLFGESSGLTNYYVGDTDVRFCVNRHSPLASKPSLSQADLDTQLVTCYPQKTQYIALKEENILFISSNLTQHLDSVINNQSICFAPGYIRASIEQFYPDVVLLPFERQFTASIYIMHNKDMVLTEPDKAVIQFAAQYMQNLSQSSDLLSTNKS